MEKPLYFAYGSNINLDQMQYRCPDATVYGQAVLDNYDLRFRGSGVATVEPKEGACVYGLLWELTDKCEASLDRYEGYPRLYIKQTLEVRTFDGQRVPVMAYIMNPELHLKPSLPPRDYYLGIKAGYEQNGLPVGCLKYAFKNCLKECGMEPYSKKVQAKASQKNSRIRNDKARLPSQQTRRFYFSLFTMMSSIWRGVTTKCSEGKCFRLPVTR